MKVEEFIKKMLIKQVNSQFAWIKLGSFLVLPSFIYTWGWWVILLWFVVMVVIFIFLPETSKTEIDFMNHAMRGVYLEYMGESDFEKPIIESLFGETWKKMAMIVVMLCYLIFALNLIAEEHLIIGSLLYYPSMLVVFRLLVEYADISKKSEHIIEEFIIKKAPEDDEDDEQNFI